MSWRRTRSDKFGWREKAWKEVLSDDPPPLNRIARAVPSINELSRPKFCQMPSSATNTILRAQARLQPSNFWFAREAAQARPTDWSFENVCHVMCGLDSTKFRKRKKPELLWVQETYLIDEGVSRRVGPTVPDFVRIVFVPHWAGT